MTRSHYVIGFWGVTTLVFLRLLVGWHFLTQGVGKLDADFSSAGFLRSANGPLAEFYKSFAPLPHDWDILIVEPLPAIHKFSDKRRYVDKEGDLQESPTEVDRIGHIPFPTTAYGAWARRVAQDWSDTVEGFKNLPGISEEQRDAADRLFQQHYIRLVDYIEEHRADIEDYHHKLSRLKAMTESDARGELPYLEERILKKRAELNTIPRPWVADVQAEEDVFYSKLASLAAEEQLQNSSFAAKLEKTLHPTSPVVWVDRIVTWVILIVGGCLILGLFTRLAAVAGAAFLLSAMSTQPPWAEGVLETVKLLTAYQGIEFVALLVLAATGAGAWAGLDGLIRGHRTIELE